MLGYLFMSLETACMLFQVEFLLILVWWFFSSGKQFFDHLGSSADHTHLEINDQNSYHCNLQFITFQKIYGSNDNSKHTIGILKNPIFFFSASQILTTNFRTQRPILSRSERVLLVCTVHLTRLCKRRTSDWALWSLFTPFFITSPSTISC